MGASGGGSVRPHVIHLACGGWVWFGMVDLARLEGVVAGLGGPAGLVRRACVREVALPWGLCLRVVVSRALWGAFFPRSVAGLTWWGGVAHSAWLALLPRVFAFLPVPVPFSVPSVRALSPYFPWC